MKFENVKLIEDASNGEFNKTITVTLNNLLVGPTDIQTAEWYEERLIKQEVPYVLVQFETATDEVSGTTKYARGYGLFINQKVGFVSDVVELDNRLSDEFDDETESAA